MQVSVMFGIEGASATVQAGALVGIVLVEALVLYVGYGQLERLLGPTVLGAIEG
jgi:hypothetical protein